MSRPRFSWPFTGTYPVTSPWGPRDGAFHTGADFGLPMGTAVLAAAPGRVIYVATEDAAGLTVTLEHEDGYQTRYHHLGSTPLRINQTVSRGVEIARSNNTGASTGAHLHFEIRPSASTTVDPYPILVADNAPPPPPPSPSPGDPDVDQFLYSCTIDGHQRWFRCTGTGYLVEIGGPVAVAMGPYGAGARVVTLEPELGVVAWNAATRKAVGAFG